MHHHGGVLMMTTRTRVEQAGTTIPRRPYPADVSAQTTDPADRAAEWGVPMGLAKAFLRAAAGMILLGSTAGAARPNMLWIVVEDMSCHFGYQGEKLVETPHVDRLAREGVVFRNAYVTAPVCSASRSAMITGMYQTTIGAQHHRSSLGTEKIRLPEGVRPIPALFREAGYYTCNAAFSAARPGEFGQRGKDDYNFIYDRRDLYDGADWSGRSEGQPFFAQIQLRGGKLRNSPGSNDEVRSGLDELVSPVAVKLPPYYPDHPAFREDWADYLNAVRYTDKEVGLIMARLEKERLLESTIIIFITDHGISQARGKQFLYDEGAKIPFVVWAPQRIKGGVTRDEPIVHIDMAASSLAWAGIALPENMQGRPLFGPDAAPRDHVVLARDRCDETEDRIRGIRQGDFKYIRNYHPRRPYLQPCAYKDHKPWMQPLRELWKAGELDRAQSLIMAETRPEEELYDLSSDPFEVDNLAVEPGREAQLAGFRRLLERWETESDDYGRTPEPMAMYDSDMAAYLSPSLRKKSPEYAAEVEANIILMKEWRAEGR
jgi:arylsulfatase A-like enzyme